MINWTLYKCFRLYRHYLTPQIKWELLTLSSCNSKLNDLRKTSQSLNRKHLDVFTIRCIFLRLTTDKSVIISELRSPYSNAISCIKYLEAMMSEFWIKKMNNHLQALHQISFTDLPRFIYPDFVLSFKFTFYLNLLIFFVKMRSSIQILLSTVDFYSF